MAVFTSVSPAQLSVWLDAYAVGDLLELQGIAEGIENSNFFVVTRGGTYVLTLFERLGPADLPFYIHLLAHLAERGIPCPAPVANRQGAYLSSLNGKPALLMSRLPGTSLTDPGTADCAAMGALLASLHLAGASYAQGLDNPRGPGWWRQTASQVMPFLPAAEQAMLSDELAFQLAARRDDLPRGVIHADLFKDNVLFDGARIGGVIDFYFACVDWLLFDLAVTVNDWCIDPAGELCAERVVALLQAYNGLRPLTRAESLAWPAMLRAAALRFWLSRLHDLHLPRPGELVVPRNPARYCDILRLRRAAGPRQPWLQAPAWLESMKGATS